MNVVKAALPINGIAANGAKTSNNSAMPVSLLCFLGATKSIIWGDGADCSV